MPHKVPGSGKAIPLFEKDGYFVSAVRNPLTAYAADVATTRRVIDARAGRGRRALLRRSRHQGAAVGAKNVNALVYLCALDGGRHDRGRPAHHDQDHGGHGVDESRTGTFGVI
ncbi:MAG: hypothetical protein ABI960_00630 [Candidatus Eisenbacteria bacterium]